PSPMTPPVGETPLCPALREALRTVEFPGAGRISLAGETFDEDSPRKLRAVLAGALYRNWHAGAAPDADGRGTPLRRVPAFEDRLTAVVPHTHTSVPAELAETPAAPDAESVTVRIGRLLVRVPVAAVRPRGGPGGAPRPGTPVTVELPAVRPALSPGFLLVDGGTGLPAGGAGDRPLRLYAHITDADAAPAVWGTVLLTLADQDLPYRAKVLSRPWSYPRRDALVVYLHGPHAERGPAARALTAALADVPGVGDTTSLFAHRTGPGTALAWDPDDERPAHRGTSFGQHRSAAVAEGIVRHALAPDAGPLERSVAEALTEAGADSAAPFRNTGSPVLPLAPV
ncbi:T3SS effector HopA1 family protein, partial [Streptomyces clavuligerus]